MKATHCRRGHEFTAANTYVDGRGRRTCRTCRAATEKKRPPRDRRHLQSENHRAKVQHIRVWKAAHGCLHCGESDPIVLDLHHPTPAGEHLRVRYRARARRSVAELSWVALEAELLKCEVLCANCHRREEHRRRLDKERVA